MYDFDGVLDIARAIAMLACKLETYVHDQSRPLEEVFKADVWTGEHQVRASRLALGMEIQVDKAFDSLRTYADAWIVEWATMVDERNKRAYTAAIREHARWLDDKWTSEWMYEENPWAAAGQYISREIDWNDDAADHISRADRDEFRKPSWPSYEILDAPFAHYVRRSSDPHQFIAPMFLPTPFCTELCDFGSSLCIGW